MEYFNDLERGMKAKGIVYEANIWDFGVPVYSEAAVDLTEDLHGTRVVRVTAMDGRKIQPMDGLPLKGVIITIKNYGVDKYEGVEPMLEVDFNARSARLDTADLYSTGEDDYAEMLREAVSEIASSMGFLMKR